MGDRRFAVWSVVVACATVVVVAVAQQQDGSHLALWVGLTVFAVLVFYAAYWVAGQLIPLGDGISRRNLAVTMSVALAGIVLLAIGVAGGGAQALVIGLLGAVLFGAWSYSIVTRARS